MDALSNELRRELTRRVFPELRYGGDPAIDRYFVCRKEGKMGEALSLYNGPLRMRYPDDQSRILLLRLYRENDPRWSVLQERLILELGGRISAAVARNIDVLVTPLLRVDTGNAWKALGAVEALLRILGQGEDDALAYLDRYGSLATLLGHRVKEMEKAQALVREYLAIARAESPSEYDFIARSEGIEKRRREAEAGRRTGASQTAKRETNYDFVAGSAALEQRRKREEEARTRFFDLSRVHFSAMDKARIEIPEAVTRREDRVLSFCWKYWELVHDPGFERLVFLYSKKNGSRHYAIFHAIKVGRQRSFTDDEILTAVSTILSSSYSYSVSGDLYMQTSWRRLKARAEAERAAALEAAAKKAAAKMAETQPRRALPAPVAAAPAAAPVAAAPVAARTAPIRQKPAVPPQTAPAPGRAELEPRPAAAATQAVPKAAAPMAAVAKAETPKPAVQKADAPQTARPPADKKPADRTPISTSSATKTVDIRPVDEDSRRKKTKAFITQGREAKPTPLPLLTPRGGSVSDRIRRLSGKAYDVYKQIFLEQVRDDIHRSLLARRTRAFRLFDDSANEAEDIVYDFMTRHYANPYMDWEESPERAKVESLGYALPSLDVIIESWFRRLA